MPDRVIGVDVGGTKVSVAVLEGSKLHEPRILATDASYAAHLIDQLVGAIEEAGPANAVGVAVPSVVDFASGSVRASVNVPLADVALRDVLRERIGVAVVVDNDATCAALAEAYDDDGALVARHLVMFTIGTGVGAGIVIDGRVYRGATGAAAELLGPAREEAARHVLTGVGTRTQICQARYGWQAGVRGAALLATQEVAREREVGVR